MARFLQWRKGFPGLLWSICQRESRLEVFTRWRGAGFDAPQLLKNAAFRKQAVMEQDYPLLVEFWDMIHAGRPAGKVAAQPLGTPASSRWLTARKHCFARRAGL